MASSRQSDIGADTSRSLEARRIVDRRLEAECSDWADTAFEPGFNSSTGLGRETSVFIRLLVKYVLPLLAPFYPKRAARVVTKILIDRIVPDRPSTMTTAAVRCSAPRSSATRSSRIASSPAKCSLKGRNLIPVYP